MTDRLTEVNTKLAQIRQILASERATALRLRGTDWFAWITAGASNTVLLAQETGIAEVLVTAAGAWVLTDEIEAGRLRDEELPSGFSLHVTPWKDADPRKAFVMENTAGGSIISDRPTLGELSLPAALVTYKRTLLASEIERYREVGHLAAAAMTEVLQAAQPAWTEYQLAGAGAEAMLARGLQPALTLAAGARRVYAYRHPTPSDAPLENYAMLVFCARKYGLYANLTRFVSFQTLSSALTAAHRQIWEIEAEALAGTQPEHTINTVYARLANAYAARSVSSEIDAHHQGGSTGYLSREVVATPTARDVMLAGQAFAWNPSLPGVKVEDTFLLRTDGALDNLTYDADWPTIEIHGRLRPRPLER